MEKNLCRYDDRRFDKLVYDYTTSHGGIPACLGYEGFPKSVCTSINNEICHGIPSEKVVLKDGDIINVDCTTIVHKHFADASRMFCIGHVSEEAKRLVEVTKECLEIGKEAVRPGIHWRYWCCYSRTCTQKWLQCCC